MKSIFRWSTKYIDYRTAWKAALFMGGLVWWINYSHGALAAFPAAVKQASYTFFVAGFIVRLCENISVNSQLDFMAMPLATVIPSLIAVSLTYLVHSLKGTPEPLYSTIPTMLMAPPSFFIWAYRSRQKQQTLIDHAKIETCTNGN